MHAEDLTALECESKLIDTTHAELTGAILAKWNLPLPIQQAGMFHHAPELAAGGELHLAHLVRAADRISNELGHSLVPRPPTEEPDDEYLEAIGLAGQRPALLAAFEPEFDAFRAYF